MDGVPLHEGRFLELTEKEANELGRPFCPTTAVQMEKYYVDDGNV